MTAIAWVALIALPGSGVVSSAGAEWLRFSQSTPPAAPPAPAPPPAVAPAPASAPSAAVPAPGAPAPATPATGTPAAVLDDREFEGILGKSVRSNTGEDMGRIVDIIVSRAGHVRAAIIDFGGFLGVGSRKIAVDWSALRFGATGKDPTTLDLNRNQVRVAPEYKNGEPVVVLGAAGGAAAGGATAASPSAGAPPAGGPAAGGATGGTQPDSPKQPPTPEK